MTSAAIMTSSAPSFVRANAQGFDFPHVRGSVHEPCQQDREGKGTQVRCSLLTTLPRLPPYFLMSPARLVPLFGQQRSPSTGELCSGCIGATLSTAQTPATSPSHATIASHLPALAMRLLASHCPTSAIRLLALHFPTSAMRRLASLSPAPPLSPSPLPFAITTGRHHGATQRRSLSTGQFHCTAGHRNAERHCREGIGRRQPLTFRDGVVFHCYLHTALINKNALKIDIYIGYKWGKVRESGMLVVSDNKHCQTRVVGNCREGCEEGCLPAPGF